MSSARHLPSETVFTSRAIWLCMWSCGSPSRLVPCSHDDAVISASSNRPASPALLAPPPVSTRVPW